MRTVGCAVKSHEVGLDTLPVRFGRVAVYDTAADRVVVIAHRATVPSLIARVWSGTVAQYYADWECD